MHRFEQLTSKFLLRKVFSRVSARVEWVSGGVESADTGAEWNPRKFLGEEKVWSGISRLLHLSSVQDSACEGQNVFMSRLVSPPRTSSEWEFSSLKWAHPLPFQAYKVPKETRKWCRKFQRLKAFRINLSDWLTSSALSSLGKFPRRKTTKKAKAFHTLLMFMLAFNLKSL